MNVPTGYTALDMIGFTDKGVYNSATAYVKNDIVHYNGNLWKCLVDDTTAVTPAEGASWTVFLAEPTSAAEDIIATVEPSVVSTHQYTAGKQLILNDILYTVTAAVNIGDTLAVGTNIVASDTIVEQLTTKANTSSLATVATSGSYADLSNKPTLGTAAAKDVPASGNASTTEVVMGDDTRLSDARNAADVYPWAKAANKPIYNGSEINTSAAQTGTAQSAVAATIASGTSMDAAIGDLLDNDVTINTDIGNVKQALTDGVAANEYMNGAVNLLKNTASDGASGGVTFIVNSDKTVDVVSDGTGSNSIIFNSNLVLKKGKYKLVVLPENLDGGTNKVQAYVQAWVNNAWTDIVWVDRGKNELDRKIHEYSSDTKVRIVLTVYSGTTYNFVAKPMIALADMPNVDYEHYVQYAMTNQQLTPLVTLAPVAKSYTPTITGTNTGFTAIWADFVYSKLGNLLFISGRFTITNVGTGDGVIKISLPSDITTYFSGYGGCGSTSAPGYFPFVNANGTEIEIHSKGNGASIPSIGADTINIFAVILCH